MPPWVAVVIAVAIIGGVAWAYDNWKNPEAWRREKDPNPFQGLAETRSHYDRRQRDYKQAEDRRREAHLADLKARYPETWERGEADGRAAAEAFNQAGQLQRFHTSIKGDFEAWNADLGIVRKAGSDGLNVYEAEAGVRVHPDVSEAYKAGHFFGLTNGLPQG